MTNTLSTIPLMQKNPLSTEAAFPSGDDSKYFSITGYFGNCMRPQPLKVAHMTSAVSQNFNK